MDGPYATGEFVAPDGARVTVREPDGEGGHWRYVAVAVGGRRAEAGRLSRERWEKLRPVREQERRTG